MARHNESPLDLEYCEAFDGEKHLGLVIVKNALSEEDIEQVFSTPQALGSVFADDRTDSLEFIHNGK